jgi:hypothetical protein
VVKFSDHPSALTGVVRDSNGTATPDPWVIVFPVDRAFWFGGSMRIAAVKPNGQGQFAIRNLPSGEYRVIASVDIQQNEWFDPDVLQGLLSKAGPLTIAGVEAKTLELVLR